MFAQFALRFTRRTGFDNCDVNASHAMAVLWMRLRHFCRFTLCQRCVAALPHAAGEFSLMRHDWFLAVD
jgi:hypothetical protein